MNINQHIMMLQISIIRPQQQYQSKAKQRPMLKRLKSEIFPSETLRILNKAKFDKSHEFIHPKYIYQISILTKNPKSRSEIFNFIHQNINSTNKALRIKTLLLLHISIRSTFDEELFQMIQNFEAGKMVKAENDINWFIQQKAVSFYIYYLKKLYIHKETILFVRKYNQKNFSTKEDSKEDYSIDIQVISNGFKIVNLCRYLFESQEMFNKMGRYYIEYQQILSMYIQILSDLDLYNQFINISVGNAIRKCQKFEKKQNKKFKIQGIQVQNLNISAQNSKQKNQPPLISNEEEEIKHFFLYVSETQKISDNLYEFFHNRYYYKKVKETITFPIFLRIHQKLYKKFQEKASSVDKKMVKLVKKSKYDISRSIENKICFTEQSSFQEGGNNFSEIKNNMTEVYEGKHKQYRTFNTFEQLEEEEYK